jgi:uncharacterized protein (TIGR02145 family)
VGEAEEEVLSTYSTFRPLSTAKREKSISVNNIFYFIGMNQKNIFLLIQFILIGLLLTLTNSCQHDETTLDPVSDVIFNTSKTYGTMTDADGNRYKTITIGAQTWMAENLRVTKYRNGEYISHITKNEDWESQTSGAYCSYENTTEKAKIATYGRLYNWFAVTDIRNIAPEGWHMPDDTEWDILSDFLGGDSIAGGEMKEIGTTHWLSPNTDATNESGFSSIPAGARFHYGSFTDIGFGGYYWSKTQNSINLACVWIFNQYHGHLGRSDGAKRTGFAVRLIKD